MTDQEAQLAAVPDTERGLYRKYELFRVHEDGTRSQVFDPFFMLRVTTDPHARAALKAYAESCHSEYPQLAADLLDAIAGLDLVEAVQGVVVESLNTIGESVVGSGFAPFTSSPIPDAEVAQILSSPRGAEPVPCKHCDDRIAVLAFSRDYVHVEGDQAGKHTCAVEPYGFHAEPVGTPCSDHPSNSRNGAHQHDIDRRRWYGGEEDDQACPR